MTPKERLVELRKTLERCGEDVSQEALIRLYFHETGECPTPKDLAAVWPTEFDKAIQKARLGG